jgi:hypothetical protein
VIQFPGNLSLAESPALQLFGYPPTVNHYTIVIARDFPMYLEHRLVGHSQTLVIGHLHVARFALFVDFVQRLLVNTHLAGALLEVSLFVHDLCDESTQPLMH